MRSGPVSPRRPRFLKPLRVAPLAANCYLRPDGPLPRLGQRPDLLLELLNLMLDTCQRDDLSTAVRGVRRPAAQLPTAPSPATGGTLEDGLRA
jgi:hypothetical protein